MPRFAQVVGGAVIAACCFVQAAGGEPPASQPADASASRPASAAATSEQPPPAGGPAAATSAQPGRRLLWLDELSFDLGFEGRADRRTYDYRSGYRVRPRYHGREESHGFEETLGLRAAGSLINERVLNFDLAGRWGLSQEWYSEDRPGRTRTGHPHGDIDEYDLSLTLLPYGTLSADAWASRHDDRIPRAFLPSLDRTQERFGVDLALNHRTLPMRLSFEHEWEELDSGSTTRLRDRERRGRNTLRYEATWQISRTHALRLEYKYVDSREQYSGTRTRFDTNRHYLLIDHTLRFGPDDRSVLETLARIQEENGQLARDLGEWSTRLRLQHTDRLATHYRVQFLRESFQQLATRTWRGEIGASYQWSDDLTGSADLYGYRQSADRNSDFSEWGALASLAYHKDNALGHFSANLAYNHTSTETDNGRRQGIIIGEAVTLRDPQPAYLAHVNVNLLTVVVTDQQRRRIYLLGRDYLLVPLGRYTALLRVPTGRIADGQTVLVAYTYRVLRDYDVARDRIDLRIQQRFDFGLTPYYAASIQNEDINHAGYLAFRSRDINRHRLGLTYRQRRWSLGAEYEYNDDTIDPYQAVHLNGDAVFWQDARRQLDGKGTLSRFWFDGARWLPARHTTLLDLGLSYRQVFARQVETTAGVLYRYEDDSLYGLTHGVDLNAAVVWKIGYFSLRFEAEYDLLRLPRSTDDGFSVWLKLTREIPVITRKRS